MDPATVVLRLFIGFNLALGIGLERQLSRKPAGFGTFTFVSTGACVIAIMAEELQPDNMLPLLGGAITGIGFLGAGSLIRSQDRVFGFTTAALIWAMAAMGLAVGVGLFYLSFTFYGVVWVVILTDRLLERQGFGSHAKVLDIVLAEPANLEDVKAVIPVKSAYYERYSFDKGTQVLEFKAHVRIKPAEVENLLTILRNNAMVISVTLE
jgi:putative Mg2+ transporter-C (MgtC) family protein